MQKMPRKFVRSVMLSTFAVALLPVGSVLTFR